MDDIGESGLLVKKSWLYPRSLFVSIVLAILFVSLTGCVKNEVVKSIEKTHPSITLRSNIGDMKISLYSDVAPNAVSDLLELVETGYFNEDTYIEARPGIGLVIVKLGESVKNFDFQNEPNGLSSKRGSLGITKLEVSDSYLNNLFVGYNRLPDMEKYYTIIGQVTSGLDLLEKSANGARYKINSFVISR